MRTVADIPCPERFRFESVELGLRLWREPGRWMTLEPIIRRGVTWGIANGYPDKLIGYWVKIEGLFPKRLDELLGETTSFGFVYQMAELPVRWHFESVTWMEGWDTERQTAVVVGHAQPHAGPSSHPHIREQMPDAEESIAAWWTETS